MSYMKDLPDKAFDLAIVDPPYGISINANMGRKKGKAKRHDDVKWDDEIPNSEYWHELFRVSKNQIIWGGNYFPEIWANGCKHFIFWDKLTPEGMSFSDGELAWTSFDMAIRKYTFRNITNDKIHPTQKPVALYKWLLKNYAKEGDNILDTHLGSGSIAIAAYDYGFDLVGCELDPEYYKAALNRFNAHKSQQKLFV
jgi:site-specific DNA-methyltransferase (adenine-specific)